MSRLSKVFNKMYDKVTHLIGTRSNKYYYEDFVRVYPDGLVFDRYGKPRKTTKDDIKNFVNHSKFYKFASQFISDKTVADVGCGTAYGCEILKKIGASRVYGSDISEPAIEYAKKRYSEFADFTVQGITDLNQYRDDLVDISISSEVLEHIKEYGMENKAICELKRITRGEGLIIIGTPNSEMLPNHGFSFNEIDALFKKHFRQYCIFENALTPYGERKSLWEKRLSENKVGIIVSELIDTETTVIPKDTVPEFKKGIQAGHLKFYHYDIDTTLLHNTHSFIAIAINNK